MPSTRIDLILLYPRDTSSSLCGNDKGYIWVRNIFPNYFSRDSSRPRVLAADERFKEILVQATVDLLEADFL